MVLSWPDKLAVPSADLQCSGDVASLPILASRAWDEAENQEGDTSCLVI